MVQFLEQMQDTWDLVVTLQLTSCPEVLGGPMSQLEIILALLILKTNIG